MRGRLLDENSWQQYLYHQKDMSGIPYLPTRVGTAGIEISLILPPHNRFKLQLILSTVFTYLPMRYSKTILKTQATVHPRKKIYWK